MPDAELLLVSDCTLAPTACDPFAKGVKLVAEPARAAIGMIWEDPEAMGDLTRGVLTSAPSATLLDTSPSEPLPLPSEGGGGWPLPFC
jgi:hypothetical protein